MAQRASYNQQSYLPNGANASGPAPGATPLLPNQGRTVQAGSHRILCIADIRGNLKSLNELAKKHNADCIIHTGDFGFYDDKSLDRIAERTLKHVAQFSPLLNESTKRSIAQANPQSSVKERFQRENLPLSELPQFLNGTLTLQIPVYTVWGACEDVQVLDTFRSGTYKVHNLHLLDEAHSRLLETGGVKLRLLGLGGAMVMHKLFDIGQGRSTIAGGQGTMWTTLLQMGELVDTANRVYDPTETRLFVTHASPAREGLLNQLSVALKADFSISAGLHFRYGSSYNEFSINPTLDHYRGKLAVSKASFNDVWETVKSEVERVINDREDQQRLLNAAIDVVHKMPNVANGGNPFGGPAAEKGSGMVDESAFKNMWAFNLADAAYGQLILEIEGGRIATEMKAQGFNFAHRGGKAPPTEQTTQQGAPPPYTPQSAQPRVTSQQLPPAGPAGQAPVQLQQAKPAPAQQTRAAPSPAQGGAKESIKPATPQRTQTPATAEKSADAKANGAKSSDDKAADTPGQTKHENEKKPGLFVMNVKDEAEVRSLLAEEDRAKVIKVDKIKYFYVAFFDNHEDQQAALGRVSSDYKSGKPDVPSVKPYKNFEDRRMGGAGHWQGSGRGGNQGGYRSGGGGTASDSEGGRGRGGSYRGGGRGGRGGERGRGRGRGGFGKGGQGGAAAGGDANTTSSTPAGGES